MIYNYCCTRNDRELLRLSKLKMHLRNYEIDFIKSKACRGKTLYCSFLRKFNNKIVEVVYAVRVYKDKLEYQEVLRRIEGNLYCLTKNIYYGRLCGYCVVWDSSNQVGYYYDKNYMYNKWFIESIDYYNVYTFKYYNIDDLIKLDNTLKYCSWDGNYPIINYVSIYRKYPKLEIMSKLGYLHFINSIQFIRKLEDKNFIKYLHKNRYSHFKFDLKVYQFLKAFKLGYSLDHYANSKLFIINDSNVDYMLNKVAKKYNFLLKNYDHYKMLFPHSSSDLVREGSLLHHCVGRMGYDKKMAREECLIIFIRDINDINRPLYTMEYDLKQKYIKQFYGFKNTVPPLEVINLFNNWLIDINCVSEV